MTVAAIKTYIIVSRLPLPTPTFLLKENVLMTKRLMVTTAAETQIVSQTYVAYSTDVVKDGQVNGFGGWSSTLSRS